MSLKNNTLSSLLTLGALFLGVFLSRFTSPVLDQFFGGSSEFFGPFYLSILQLCIIPLITALIIKAILDSGTKLIAATTGPMLLINIIMLLSAVILTSILSMLLVNVFTIGPDIWPQIPLEGSKINSEVVKSPFLEGIKGLLLINPIKGVTRGLLFQLIVGTFIFSILVRISPIFIKERVLRVTNKILDITQKVLSRILFFLPLGVFALSYMYGSKLSFDIVSFLTFGALGEIIVCLSFVGFIFLVALVFKINFSNFFRFLYPSQLIAITTRSSVATIPVLIQDGLEVFGIDGAESSFVISISSTFFKVSRAISPLFKLIFFMAIFNLELSIFEIFVFSLTCIVTSMSTPGIPGGNQMSDLPLFVALGIPAAAYVLIKSVRDLPDSFITLANTTGYGASAFFTNKLKTWLSSKNQNE
jgi:Na+/H+-dicarboxylate symporter